MSAEHCYEIGVWLQAEIIFLRWEVGGVSVAVDAILRE